MNLETNEAKWIAWQDHCYANYEYWNKQRSIYPTDWEAMAQATSWAADCFEAKKRTGRFTKLIDSIKNMNNIQAINTYYSTSRIHYTGPTRQELKDQYQLDRSNVEFEDRQYDAYMEYLDNPRD